MTDDDDAKTDHEAMQHPARVLGGVLNFIRPIQANADATTASLLAEASRLIAEAQARL